VQVKQADNPTFSFLHPDDPLHPFYNYLKVNKYIYTCRFV
jgi:hypothetical protein